MTKRYCIHCDQDKPEDEFHGYRTICKICAKKATNQWRDDPAHPERKERRNASQRARYHRKKQTIEMKLVVFEHIVYTLIDAVLKSIALQMQHGSLDNEGFEAFKQLFNQFDEAIQRLHHE